MTDEEVHLLILVQRANLEQPEFLADAVEAWAWREARILVVDKRCHDHASIVEASAGDVAEEKREGVIAWLW
jgi:hypothetical protein